MGGSRDFLTMAGIKKEHFCLYFKFQSSHFAIKVKKNKTRLFRQMFLLKEALFVSVVVEVKEQVIHAPDLQFSFRYSKYLPN